jgi:hypothetical protein
MFCIFTSNIFFFYKKRIKFKKIDLICKLLVKPLFFFQSAD